MKTKSQILAFIFFILFEIEELYAKKITDSGFQKIVDVFQGITISGQATAIYQSSNVDLKAGDLKNADNSDFTSQEVQAYNHKDAAGTFSADVIVEKKFNENEFLHFDLQFASGLGVDANLQGGAMVNSDVMEDANNHNEIYLAKAFYERKIDLPKGYNITFDIGKFGVNDFFDIGDENSDQTTQFLNQAVVNNAAFDYAQGLDGHGYTYGARAAINNDFLQIDLGFFSSDSYLDNIADKNSIIVGLSLMPEFFGQSGLYQIYAFKNRGEYGSFDDDGNFITQNADNINTENNEDTLDKNGFGISITQAINDKINVFAKFGRQDDDRDVRHYNDADESYMVGGNFSGQYWSRKNDEIGVAFATVRLTGNHRKAHEKGYSSLFDRDGGVGAGNYDDETVLEAYYRLGLSKNSSLSFDAQHISNFYYSKLIGNAQFFAARFNASF
jgi:hypothetical protein